MRCCTIAFMSKFMPVCLRSFVPLTLLLLARLTYAASVTFEAEAGVLGTDFTNGTTGAVQFISISTDTVNSGYPGNANRVATYTVTFPAAGTYQLYARILVGPGGFNDDSMFYASSFGTKNPTLNADWITVNGLAGVGFSNSTDVVTGGGTLGNGMWKWINLSQFTSQSGFTVSAGNLTQTIQIGARENGLGMDKFVFGTTGYTFTVSSLDNGTDGAPPAPPVCTVNWPNLQQHIDGFGFSSAWCGQLSSAKNNALYKTLGMSILRVRIDETGAWSDETANASAAHAAGVKVLGSPWSAPVVWSSNGSNSGGYLLPSHYADYANWLSNATVSMGLDYVSIQNEPDYSAWMNWTAAEMFNFMKTNAPAIGKPIVMPESFHFSDSYSDPVINDSTAGTNFSIVGGHFYGGGNYVHTNDIAHCKPVWMTEHYLDGGTTNFPICLTWAKEINDAMNNQFNAYIAWWVYDGDTNINLANNSGTIFKDGYTIGQFAKFIRPGYYRIGTTNTTGGVQISAYKDLTTSNYVIVALNLGSTAVTQQFNLNGFLPGSAVTPWITSYTQSLAVQTPITNVSSTFTYSIQPSNIVTFVGVVPPMVPANLTATPGLNEVTLSWSAVTGASSYNVKRFPVSVGTYVTLTNVAGTSFADTNIVVGTPYYYVVSAVNISGESPNSVEASVITVPYYAIEPVADSYVDNSTPASNYGALGNLLVENSSTAPIRNAYYMFDVHALGNCLSATLTLVPNRVDDTTVPIYYELAPTNWTENGITWNNQPGGTGVFLYTNTATGGVPITIDVTRVVVGQATNGGLLSIRITQRTNSLSALVRFCPKEYPSPSWQPVLTYSVAANTAPTLAAISNQTIGVGTTLNITNSATDADVPAQALTFSLLTAPTNVVIGATNGVLIWRPLVTQANSTNPFTVMVADNGTPSMSATQNFAVTVSPLAQPQIPAMSLSGGQMMLQVNGATGPDYQIQSSTDLANWSVVLTTNSPTMPFVWTNNITGGPPMNFYRILAGPPFQ